MDDASVEPTLILAGVESRRREQREKIIHPSFLFSKISSNAVRAVIGFAIRVCAIYPCAWTVCLLEPPFQFDKDTKNSVVEIKTIIIVCVSWDYKDHP